MAGGGADIDVEAGSVLVGRRLDQRVDLAEPLQVGTDLLASIALADPGDLDQLVRG